jgi:hypothetical protein
LVLCFAACPLIVFGQAPQVYSAASAGSFSAPAAPKLQWISGGGLSQTTYFVKVTYTSPGGETTPSAESSLKAGGGKLLLVVSPSMASNAMGWNVYVSTSSGMEELQNGSTPLALGTTWVEPASGLPGVGQVVRNPANVAAADPTVTTPGGTIGYLPYFDTSSDIVNSVMFQSGVNIGIGATAKFTRGSANYIQASSIGGWLDFVVNGKSPSDANAALRLNVNGEGFFKRLWWRALPPAIRICTGWRNPSPFAARRELTAFFARSYLLDTES